MAINFLHQEILEIQRKRKNACAKELVRYWRNEAEGYDTTRENDIRRTMKTCATELENALKRGEENVEHDFSMVLFALKALISDMLDISMTDGISAAQHNNLEYARGIAMTAEGKE